MSKIRVGIAGLGGIAKRIHIPVLQSFPDVEVAAGAEKNAGQRERVQGLFNIPKVYDDFEAMIRAGGLDAVYVCLPSFLHRKACFAAFDAGCHVLCEKPMGVSVEESEAIAARAASAGKVLMPAYNFRFTETFQQARRMIADGVLGKILMVQSVFMNPGPYLSWDPKSEWYFQGNKEGALYDSGCHVVDISLYLMAEALPVPEARVLCARAYSGFEVPTNVSCSFRLGKDALWSVDVGWRSGAEFLSVAVNGSAGMIRVTPHTLQWEHRGTDPLDRILGHIGNAWAQGVRLGRRLGRIALRRDLPFEYRCEAEAFLNAVRSGAPLPVRPEDAIAVHRVLGLAAERMETGEE